MVIRPDNYEDEPHQGPPNENNGQDDERINAAIARERANEVGRMLRRKLDDSLCYLLMVKNALVNDPAAYERFLTVMRAMDTKEIEIMQCMMRIGALFRSNPLLIDMFNIFVPIDATLTTENGRVVIRSPDGVIEVPEDYTWEDTEEPDVVWEAPVQEPEQVGWQW